MPKESKVEFKVGLFVLSAVGLDDFRYACF